MTTPPRLSKPLVQTKVGRSFDTAGGVLTASVASILERESDATIQSWLDLVEQSAELMRIPLGRTERMGHLRNLLRDLILRLRLDSRGTVPISKAAREHGEIRLRQGYTAAMVVEESRFLQVSIFGPLHRNLSRVDFSKVLSDVVTIADERDSQLRQAVLCFESIQQ
jgi:RsbT co-antagonist protein rsbRD N-terminal domain